MDVGIWIAGGGLLVSGAAVVVATMALLASRRSASAAQQSATAALDSVEEARRMRELAERTELLARAPVLSLQRAPGREVRSGEHNRIPAWVVADRDLDKVSIELVVDPIAPNLNAAQWIAAEKSPETMGGPGPLTFGPLPAGTRAVFWVWPLGPWNGRSIRVRCVASHYGERWPPVLLEVKGPSRPPVIIVA